MKMVEFTTDDLVAFPDVLNSNRMISENVIRIKLMGISYIGRVITHGFFIELHLESIKVLPASHVLDNSIVIQKECMAKSFPKNFAEKIHNLLSIDFLFYNGFKIL